MVSSAAVVQSQPLPLLSLLRCLHFGVHKLWGGFFPPLMCVLEDLALTRTGPRHIEGVTVFGSEGRKDALAGAELVRTLLVNQGSQ